MPTVRKGSVTCSDGLGRTIAVGQDVCSIHKILETANESIVIGSKSVAVMMVW